MATEADTKPGALKTIILSVVTGFLCGVGTMNIALASDVRDNKVNVGYLKTQISDNRLESLEHWKETNQLVTKALEQITSLVNRLDVQNKILQDQANALNAYRGGAKP